MRIVSILSRKILFFVDVAPGRVAQNKNPEASSQTTLRPSQRLICQIRHSAIIYHVYLTYLQGYHYLTPLRASSKKEK